MSSSVWGTTYAFCLSRPDVEDSRQRERAFQLADCEHTPCHIMIYIMVRMIKYCFYQFIVSVECEGGVEERQRGKAKERGGFCGSLKQQRWGALADLWKTLHINGPTHSLTHTQWITCIMNNSYLCWLPCTPALLAPHTLFVVVLFSSCESTQLFVSTHIRTERNFGCLQHLERRLNSLLLFYLFIYFYHCRGKITLPHNPPLLLH